MRFGRADKNKNKKWEKKWTSRLPIDALFDPFLLSPFFFWVYTRSIGHIAEDNLPCEG